MNLKGNSSEELARTKTDYDVGRGGCGLWVCVGRQLLFGAAGRQQESPGSSGAGPERARGHLGRHPGPWPRRIAAHSPGASPVS
jgi:hypothetical protein